MNDWQIAGLPLHPLLVHFVVVLLPVAALMVVLGSVLPAARRRMGWFTPLVALVALAFVPLAKEAGEALERTVGESDLLEKHAELGDHLLPWAIGLFVLAAAQWLWTSYAAKNANFSTAAVRKTISVGLAVVAIVVAVGATINVVQVGDSGARAVWSESD